MIGYQNLGVDLYNLEPLEKPIQFLLASGAQRRYIILQKGGGGGLVMTYPKSLYSCVID
jgi:hypothetical protein